MGNFSRDPDARLTEAATKHYVALRMQQAVPILDADWNELDGLRRFELQDLGKWVVGNGVPAGNDGFRVAALPAGGINTVVITANTGAPGLSSLAIDLGASTAAAALGFAAQTSAAARFGDSPARLTGARSEPFGLSNNSTLTIRTDNLPPETVTFVTADFADITAATATEVATKITASIANASAAAGVGNDFVITGGDGTLVNAGRVLVEGRTGMNERDVRYSEQPLFQNAALAALWGVSRLDPLATPTIDEAYIAYVDLWDREVDSAEDSALLDIRVGVETAVRLRREWAVRVTREANLNLVFAARPAGHVFYPLARLRRRSGVAGVDANMIDDLRETQLSIQRKIEVRGAGGALVVDNPRFRRMLETTRNNVLGFIRYITTQFNPLSTALVSGEVLGIETAGHIARTSEVGLGLVSTATIANRGALEFLQQLYTAEDNFVAVWRDVVLQIGGTPKKYATYQTFITRLDNRLNQPLVGTLTGLLPALRAGDLAAAVIMQEEIARQFGVAGASVARGTIQAFLSKSPPGNLTAPQTVRFEFRVRSFTTLADTYTVRILPVNGWPRTVVDSGGTPVPANRIPIGPSGSQTTIFVDVTVQAGQSDLQLEITSDSNPTEVTTVTSLYTLRDGFAAPPGEDKIQLHLTNNHTNAAVDPVTGVVTIRRSQQALVEFRVFNSIGDGQPAQIALQLTRQNVVGTWPVVFDGVAGAGNATSITVNDGGSGPVQLNIQPGNDAVSAQVRVTATAPFANTTVTGEIVIALAATN